MVDAIVSALWENLAEALSSALLSEAWQLLGVSDQANELVDELRYMKTFLEDSYKVEKKKQSDTFKKVMSDWRELMYDAMDVIDDIQHEFMEQNVMSSISFRHDIGKRLKEINKRITNIKARMRSYLPAAPTSLTGREDEENQHLRYPILIDEANVVGLENDSHKIREWIFEADRPFVVIGIVGMGGVGKTTLAKKICNVDSVKHSFDHIIFVAVSQSFKLEDLVRKMLKQMQVDEQSLRGNDAEELLKRLKSELEEKKYMVILDDVWGTDEGFWWDSIMPAFPKRNCCCIIVTTRNEEVARSMGAIDRHIHHPKVLSDEDSWSLFAKVAFARDNGRCPNDIESVGKEIVARCGGLPLAIKAVGGVMQGKRCSIYEWRRISEHLKAELAEKKNDVQIISSLELSYDELPNYLRPCFLCFSMFPKDYEIDIDDIILWWIGEGFVSGRNGRTALEVGGECATELINRCLLVGERKDAFEREFITVRIHDIVRYMAIKIARDENFASLDEVGTPEFSVRARRATIFQSDGGLNLNHSATDSKLRTLFGRNVGMHVILNQELEPCKMKRLRVLHVSFIYHDLKDQEGIVTEFLNGLASLSYLIVLKMENCAFPNLPDSIGELHNLQILCLHRWVKLKILPPSITKLDKLTIFRIYVCPLLERMPDGIGRLSNMEKLSGFKPAILSYGNSSRFDELKNLLQLRELHVNLTNPDQLEEGELNLLSGLQNLQALVIQFPYGAEAKSLESKVNYHQLSPLRRLEVLSIYHCPEKSTPVWLNPTSFPNLQFLEIFNGRFTRMGPEFWETHVGVWKLERLLFSGMGEFEEEWERFVEALPSLRMVKVSLYVQISSHFLLMRLQLKQYGGKKKKTPLLWH